MSTFSNPRRALGQEPVTIVSKRQVDLVESTENVYLPLISVFERHSEFR